MEKYKTMAVYGGGSWGTALACQVARHYDNVSIFLRDIDIIEEIKVKRTNAKYLSSDVLIPNNIIPTNRIEDILDKEVIIIAVPSFAFEYTINKLKDAGINKNTVLLIATKGFGKNPTELLSDKTKSILPNNPFAFIAGPNLAKEVAINLSTSVTIASLNIDIAKKLAISLISKQFQVTITDYIVAIQVAGALKNIIAIQSGLYDAKGYGQNAKAGLITGGIQEIKVLSEAIDGELGDNSILFSPGILGDVVLTCYSKASRNNRFGYELGQQEDIKKFLDKNSYLVEGRESVKLALELITKYNLTMPIVSSVASALLLL